MTDQIPADKVRDLRDQYARLIEDAGTKEAQAYYGHVVDDLEALLPAPPRPTLADMSDAERAACRRMQADVEGRSERYVIAAPYDGDTDVALIGPDWEFDWIEPDCVTPRPDLPRMEWPGTEKPAPAPALPEGWRLADHPRNGRVIVTRPDPDDDGEVAITSLFTTKATRALQTWCDPAELTYLDQEDGTSDTVPESTLAVGSAWEDADALAQACKESERNQIVVVDKRGDVSVWDAELRGWRAYAPGPVFAPYTIIHAGRKADQ